MNEYQFDLKETTQQITGLLNEIIQCEEDKVKSLISLKFDRFSHHCQIQKQLIDRVTKTTGKKLKRDPSQMNLEQETIWNQALENFSDQTKRLQSKTQLTRTFLIDLDKILSIYDQKINTGHYNQEGKVTRAITEMKSVILRG